MPLDSRQKGARGERDVAAILRRRGLDASRGYQARGGEEQPDIVQTIPNVRLEVKRVERLNIWAALLQAERDLDPADDTTTPVVVFKRNRSRWYVAMPLEDWLDQMGYFENEGGEG